MSLDADTARPRSESSPRAPGRDGSARRTAGAVLAVLLVGVVCAGGGWAARTALAPAAPVPVSAEFVDIEAVPGLVESSLRVNATATWTEAASATNMSAGTVTSLVHQPGARASEGTVLYTVDMRPVSIAQGAVPAYRDLAVGSIGTDVSQLQTMLTALGFYTGAVDGRFREGTALSVRAWQKSIRAEVTGAVARSDLVFVPQLPASVALGEAIAVGLLVGGGEKAVVVLEQEPAFTIALSDGQDLLVTPGMPVTIAGPEGEWIAAVGDVRRSGADGQLVATLTGLPGAGICGDQCPALPVGEPILLSSSVQRIARTEGIVVPVAALASGADSRQVVVTSTGERLPVRVVEQAGGIAVVEGVADGTMVRVPGPSD